MELHPLHGMKRMVAVRTSRKHVQKDIGEEYDEYKRALADVERQLKIYTDAAAASHHAWESLARVHREFAGAMSATYKRQDAIRTTTAQFAGNMVALQSANSLADNAQATWRKLHSIVSSYLSEIAEVNKLYDPVEREFVEYVRYATKSDKLSGRRKRNEEKIARNIEKRDKHKAESSALLDNAVTAMRVTLRKHPAVFQCALAAFWLRNQNSLTLFTNHTGQMHEQCADIAENLVSINLSDPSTYEQLLPPHSDPISAPAVERRFTEPVPGSREMHSVSSMPSLPIPSVDAKPKLAPASAPEPAPESLKPTISLPPIPNMTADAPIAPVPTPKPLKKSTSKSLFGLWGSKSSRSSGNLGAKSRSTVNITSKKSIELPGLLPSRIVKPKDKKQDVVPDQKVEPHEIAPLDDNVLSPAPVAAPVPAPVLAPVPTPAPVPAVPAPVLASEPAPPTAPVPEPELVPAPTDKRPPISPAPRPPAAPVVDPVPPPEKKPEQSAGPAPVSPKQSPSRVPTAIPPPSVATKLDISSPNKIVPLAAHLPAPASDDSPDVNTTAQPKPPLPAPAPPPPTSTTTPATNSTPPPAPPLPEFGLGIRTVSKDTTPPPPPSVSS